MYIPKSVENSILACGYEQVDQEIWRQFHRRGWAAKYFLKRKKYYLVTVAKSTGRWSIEILRHKLSYGITTNK